MKLTRGVRFGAKIHCYRLGPLASLACKTRLPADAEIFEGTAAQVTCDACRIYVCRRSVNVDDLRFAAAILDAYAGPDPDDAARVAQWLRREIEIRQDQKRARLKVRP